MSFPGSEGERRRAPRFALGLRANLRERGDNAHILVRVIDISPQGCRIEHLGGKSLQSTVWVYLDKLDARCARVVWNRDNFAGLEFETPLHEAVLDSLLGAARAMGEATASELHDIAKRSHSCAVKAREAPVSKELRELAHDCAVSALERLSRK